MCDRLPHSVLFLDLDDVLIVPSIHKIKHRRRVRDGRKVHYAFSPSGQILLLRILSECPEVALVISSTWRLEGRAEVDYVFRANGFVELLARFHNDWSTCEPSHEGTRAFEINEWLSRHPEVIRAAALDDDTSISDQLWGVTVNPVVGLSEGDAESAIALLSVPLDQS